MQKNWSMKLTGLILAAIALPAAFTITGVVAQPAASGGQQSVATGTVEPDKGGAASVQNTKSADPKPAEAEQYTQNQDSASLEERIARFNREFCPPEVPIGVISDFTLARLVKAELVKRAELEKFRNMVMINGKVYVKDEQQANDPDPKPIGTAGNNLSGSLKTACEQLEQKQIRGSTIGNKKPERLLELKRRKIVYRDRDNQLREMEVFSPPRFPAKKKAIAGKRGKLVKDYATSILLPKNQQGQNSDVTAFDDMPSADSWLDEGEGQTQK